jgi:CrcB protein
MDERTERVIRTVIARVAAITTAVERRFGDDALLPVDPDLGEDVASGHQPLLPVRLVEPGIILAVLAGGFCGTLGRYELGLAWPEHARAFPATTFVINVSGAFLIGVVLTAIIERLHRSRLARPFLCVGVLGGWTTMSTLAVEADRLVSVGRLATALGYLLATVLAGFLASSLGIAIARRAPLPDLRGDRP